MAPREYLKDSTYMISRRTLLRQFLLRPDDQVAQIWLYCLAVWAQKHKIDVHGFVLMSTHEHLNATDPHGVMGHFLRDFHRTVAKAMKKFLRLEGTFWEDKPTSVVRLETLDAFVEESGYHIANPVAALAVSSSRQWPGLIVHAEDIGTKQFVVKRPDVYFSKRSKRWPPTVTLQLTMPKLVGDYAHDEVRELIAREAERLEHDARKDAAVRGKSFMGAKACKVVSRFKRATTPEPRGDRNPTFAVGRNNPEAYAAAALAVREFRRRYRAALAAWRNKDRSATFPPGTFVMRWLHNANVAAG